ncbi:MAG: hypothetical protein K9N34_03635 [Candidatus Marinimicrobia bacterium]|nr:hypothetical protein [Candidatus Neomarinimicrobiota bacterium]MCF7839786.1 hypothetical protein [Candidatus Neomarinimicrobiota bacterium]
MAGNMDSVKNKTDLLESLATVISNIDEAGWEESRDALADIAGGAYPTLSRNQILLMIDQAHQLSLRHKHFNEFIEGKRNTLELDKGHNEPIFTEKKD